MAAGRRRPSAGLQHGVEHLHDETLAGLGELADGVELLREARGGAALAGRIPVTVRSIA